MWPSSDLAQDIAVELRENGRQTASQLAIRLRTSRTRVNQSLYRNSDQFVKTEGSPPEWSVVDPVGRSEHTDSQEAPTRLERVQAGRDSRIIRYAEDFADAEPRSDFVSLEIWIARVQMTCLKDHDESDEVRDPSVLFLDRYTEIWARLNLKPAIAKRLIKAMVGAPQTLIADLPKHLRSLDQYQLWREVLGEIRERCRRNDYVSVQAILNVIDETPWYETTDGRVLVKRSDSRSKIFRDDLGILMRRLEGQTLAAIAENFSVTRERIRQRLKNLEACSGIRIEEIQQREKARRAAQLSEVTASIRENVQQVLSDRPGITRSRLEEMSGFPWSRLRQHLPAPWLKFIVPDEAHLGEGWTREQVLEALQVAATYEYPLSRATFDELVTLGEVKCCLSQRVGQIFGKWSTACEIAGVESHAGWKEVYDRFWSNEDCVAALCDFLLSSEISRSVDAYDKWHPTQDNPLPSSGTIRNYVGGWFPGIQLAFEELSTSDYGPRLREYLSREAT